MAASTVAPELSGRTMHAFRRVSIDWRRKAAAFRLFGAMPGGRQAYYLTQRYVTRTFPRNLREHESWAFEHARSFRRLFGDDIRKARLFEFGAGWDLFNNLVQWCYGVNDQFVVDIRRWARRDQINHVIQHLRRNPPPDAVRAPEIAVTDPFDASLLKLYGIRYDAPADARSTGFDAGSIDLVCTTSVLEHVAPPALADIVRESHRICHERSVVSHVVDYTDHYAHSDASINIYNFLRFSEREWTPFNPDIHYQNRLRHFQYAELFERCGFVPVQQTAVVPPDGERMLMDVPLSEPFQSMTAEQIIPRTGHWVLKKSSVPEAGRRVGRISGTGAQQ